MDVCVLYKMCFICTYQTGNQPVLQMSATLPFSEDMLIKQAADNGNYHSAAVALHWGALRDWLCVVSPPCQWD